VIVVDASAIVDFVTHRAIDALPDRLMGGGGLHAPHLVDVEVTHALRRLVAVGELAADRASDARADAADLRIVRYQHIPLLDRAWQLRETLSVYDAVYVALAEALEAPLITCDTRLARTTGHGAEVELFPPSS
jgi:predicted nucleic acid-binding protein